MVTRDASRPTWRFRRAGRAWAAAASGPSSPGRCSAAPTARASPGSRAGTASTRRGTPTGSTWWAPRALAWWIGVLFAVGSICFALGSFPPYATGGGDQPGQPHLLHRVHLLHDRLLPAVLRDRLARPRRSTAAAAHRVSGRSSGSSTTGSTGGRRSSSSLGTLWFNRTTLSALVVGLGVLEPPPGVAPRRAGLGLLPRLELAGLGRGVPRPVRLAPVAHLVVDHRC